MIPTAPTFTSEQDAFLKAHYHKDMSARQVAEHLGVGRSAVLHRGRKLGLGPKTGPTDEQRAFIKAHYRIDMSDAEVGAKIGIARQTVGFWAKTMGLDRAPKPKRHLSAGQRAIRANTPNRSRKTAQASSTRRLERELGVHTGTRQPRRLVSAGPRMKTCQLIEGEPSADDACKCGKPTVVGGQGPYCAEHMARCYHAGSARGVAA